MTTQKTITPAQMTRLPDAPPKDPDEVSAFRHLYDRGLNDYLTFHFGNRETTLIAGDCRVLASMDDNLAQARRPELLISRHISTEAFWARGAYVISEQGKPPDFVMQIASHSTGRVDTGPKRVDYAALGSPSTGASTRPADTTSPGSRETGWCRDTTSPSLSTHSLTGA